MELQNPRFLSKAKGFVKQLSINRLFWNFIFKKILNISKSDKKVMTKIGGGPNSENRANSAGFLVFSEYW